MNKQFIWIFILGLAIKSVVPLETNAKKYGLWKPGTSCVGTATKMRIIEVPMTEAGSRIRLNTVRIAVPPVNIIGAFCSTDDITHDAVEFQIACNDGSSRTFTAGFTNNQINQEFGHFAKVMAVKKDWIDIKLPTDNLWQSTSLQIGDYNLCSYNCKIYAHHTFTAIHALFSCTWKPNNWCGFYNKPSGNGKGTRVVFACRGRDDWRRGEVACSFICQYHEYIYGVCYNGSCICNNN